MKLVSAKCPCCGAILELSKDSETIKCQYCHNTIIVDDAIACYKIKVSGNVNIDGITTNSELIEVANELLDMHEYLKAKRKFLEFSEKCPDDYHGWLGLLICRTRNFTIRDNNIMFENDINKYRDHFLRTAPNDIKEQCFEKIDRYFDPEKYEKMEREAEQLEEERFKEEKKFSTEKKESSTKKNEIKKNKNLKEIIAKAKKAISIGSTGVLYFFGICYILFAFTTPEAELSDDGRIFYSLLGLSLFKCFYTFIGKRFNISNDKLRIIRIVVPIAILVIPAIVSVS